MEPPAAPDFSPLAATYARARPTYPPELYGWLAGLVEGRELAWDCATGNGQAALGLAGHFPRIAATDRSAAQLAHAPRHRRVGYYVATADHSGLRDAGADLVTVAAALHWLDLPRFFAEVERVLRPAGVLAAWTYHTAICDPPFDRVFHRLYWELLRPFFDDRVRRVDEKYATIEMPGEPIAAPSFTVTAAWTLEGALDYVRSWSGSLAYREATGEDPADLIRDELAALFADSEHPESAPGDPEGRGGSPFPRHAVRIVRIPLFLRASRL